VRIVYRTFFLVVAVFLILFAVSNRARVSIGLWPLPFLADVPLYLLCFLSLLIGALIGLGAAWITHAGDRRELRTRRRRIDALERELTATQSQLEDHPAPGAPLPAVRQPRQFVKARAENAPQRYVTGA
jgi:lipopolysaccharide assembly protein A